MLDFLHYCDDLQFYFVLDARLRGRDGLGLSTGYWVLSRQSSSFKSVAPQQTLDGKVALSVFDMQDW
jgi:hypothetical protein